MASSKPRPPLPPGPYLVVGLARSGQAAARVLAGRGEAVVGVDAGSPEGAEGVTRSGVEIHLDGDGTSLLDRVRCVVKSPGVPLEAPPVAAARERGIPVMGELEFAWRLLPNRFIAITGTNGKTTVTELVGHLWRTAGEPVAVAGNVGTPLSALVGEVRPEATIACECSSFQLEDSETFAPECALILNLAPDHLDRHRTLDRYRDAKLRVFANQGPDDVAIYNRSDAALRELELGGRARRVAFCTDGPGADCDYSLADERILAGGEPLLDASELRLLGSHNAENAVAAAAASVELGLPRDAVREGLRSFRGVPHRLEPVAEIGGVLYVNDSKATNVAAAIRALRAFPEGAVHAILGGRGKGESFEPLAGPVAERCRACYLIGEAAAEIEAALSAARDSGIELRRCEDLEHAIAAAAGAARAGEVVLLAPACTGFDAFRDFEERGERFRELVTELEA